MNKRLEVQFSFTPKTDWCFGLMIKELLSGVDAISWNFLLKKKNSCTIRLVLKDLFSWEWRDENLLYLIKKKTKKIESNFYKITLMFLLKKFMHSKKKIKKRQQSCLLCSSKKKKGKKSGGNNQIVKWKVVKLFDYNYFSFFYFLLKLRRLISNGPKENTPGSTKISNFFPFQPNQTTETVFSFIYLSNFSILFHHSNQTSYNFWFYF